MDGQAGSSGRDGGYARGNGPGVAEVRRVFDAAGIGAELMAGDGEIAGAGDGGGHGGGDGGVEAEVDEERW